MQYYGSRLSKNISKREPEGYLYCLNVPIARTGRQQYSPSEVGMDGDKAVDVHRTADEVFSKATMASFEGIPVTRDHPSEAVDVNNIAAYSKGHVQNVRRGSGKDSDLLIGDLVIVNEDLINDILNNGLREVSCGYEYSKLVEDGKVYQVDIRGNHVAIVDKGRAGERVAIRDSVNPDLEKQTKSEKGRREGFMSKSIWARMFTSFARDEAVPQEEVAEAVDEIMSGGYKPPEAEEKKGEGMDKKMKDEAMLVKETEKVEEAKDEMQGDLATAVAALAKEVMALKEMIMTKEEPVQDEEKPVEVDPLAELENEIKMDEPMNEGSVTVDPEEIEVEDEEMTEEEVAPSEVTKEAVIAAIQELKPIVAGLPAADRKKASDAMSRALRRAVGMTEKVSANDKQALAKAARKKIAARDGANEQRDRELGRKLMEKHNPHYRK